MPVLSFFQAQRCSPATTPTEYVKTAIAAANAEVQAMFEEGRIELVDNVRDLRSGC